MTEKKMSVRTYKGSEAVGRHCILKNLILMKGDCPCPQATQAIVCKVMRGFYYIQFFVQPEEIYKISKKDVTFI